MMSSIWRTQFLALIVVHYSFFFFIALAAPVLDTPQKVSLLRKRESPHNYHFHTGRDVRSPDNTVLKYPALQNVLPPDGPRSAQRALKTSTSTEGPEAIGPRGFFDSIGKGISGAFRSVGNAAKGVVNGVKHVANKVVSGVKHVANKVVSGVKHVANKVVSGVKHVANKVVGGVKKAVKWVKDHGADIAKGAKFGLKVLSTVTSVAGRVANFIPIPGVGKLLSKGLKFASSSLDKGSNMIPGDMGRWGKAMGVMDKIQHPIDGPGGAVLDAILKRENTGLLL